ncbi:MAG: hypothetical protein ACNI27_01815 [Desulfovibrio sp.]
MFTVNEVLEYEGSLFRILQILQKQIVWININDPKAFSTLMDTQELHAALETGVLIRTEDPFAQLSFEQPAPGSSAQKKRDKNYALLQEMITAGLSPIDALRSD